MAILTNTRMRPRVLARPGVTTLSPNITGSDVFKVIGLAAGLTIENPIGNPYDGQELSIVIKDNGVSQSLIWGIEYTGSAKSALPTATTISKVHYLIFRYNSDTNLWVLVSLL